MRGLSACGVADREAALSPKGNNPLMKLKDYTAVIHLHSAYSYDGRASIPEILAAARKCAVDVLLLTDHSTIRARTEGYEGWQEGVLLIVGEEIAPRFNHYLAFGLREAVACAEKEPELPPQVYIDRVRDGGGAGFIAHPDHEGTAMFHVKHGRSCTSRPRVRLGSGELSTRQPARRRSIASSSSVDHSSTRPSAANRPADHSISSAWPTWPGRWTR